MDELAEAKAHRHSKVARGPCEVVSPAPAGPMVVERDWRFGFEGPGERGSPASGAAGRGSQGHGSGARNCSYGIERASAPGSHAHAYIFLTDQFGNSSLRERYAELPRRLVSSCSHHHVAPVHLPASGSDDCLEASASGNWSACCARPTKSVAIAGTRPAAAVQHSNRPHNLTTCPAPGTPPATTTTTERSAPRRRRLQRCPTGGRTPPTAPVASPVPAPPPARPRRR